MHSNIQYPGFIRRFLCGIYDSFLSLGVLILPGTIWAIINYFIPINPIFGIMIVIISTWSFFAYFWTRGGQTLGMAAWKIKLISMNKESISLKQTLIRFLLSVFICCLVGLPLLLIYFHPQRLAINDILSKTKLIKV